MGENNDKGKLKKIPSLAFYTELLTFALEVNAVVDKARDELIVKYITAEGKYKSSLNDDINNLTKFQESLGLIIDDIQKTHMQFMSYIYERLGANLAEIDEKLEAKNVNCAAKCEDDLKDIVKKRITDLQKLNKTRAEDIVTLYNKVVKSLADLISDNNSKKVISNVYQRHCKLKMKEFNNELQGKGKSIFEKEINCIVRQWLKEFEQDNQYLVLFKYLSQIPKIGQEDSLVWLADHVCENMNVAALISLIGDKVNLSLDRILTGFPPSAVKSAPAQSREAFRKNKSDLGNKPQSSSRKLKKPQHASSSSNVPSQLAVFSELAKGAQAAQQKRECPKAAPGRRGRSKTAPEARVPEGKVAFFAAKKPGDRGGVRFAAGERLLLPKK